MGIISGALGMLTGGGGGGSSESKSDSSTTTYGAVNIGSRTNWPLIAGIVAAAVLGVLYLKK